MLQSQDYLSLDTFLNLPVEIQHSLVSSYPYISPYTYIAEISDMAFLRSDDTPYAKWYKPFKPDSIHNGSIIYCVTDIANRLFPILRKLQKKVFLILGRSVVPVTDQFYAFIDECNVQHIFAQNCLVSPHLTSRITAIPLGHENKHYGFHGKASNSVQLLNYAKEYSLGFNQFDQILCSFSLATNVKERSMCLKAALTNSHVNITSMSFQPDHLNVQFNFYHALSISKMCLCPWGNGIDTHRFWQSLYLGSIPIVRKNPAIKSFADTRSIFIDSWDEINDSSFLSRHPSSQDCSLAFFDYWKKLISDTIAKY